MGGERSELFDIVMERLRAEGGRMTKKRERILGALLSFDRPASAEDLRERAELPSTDLVTVYRNLDAFDSVGVLQRIPLENGTQLFELTAPGEHFHHLICRECHRAERLDVCVGANVVRKAKAKGFSEIAHIMEVYGVCEDCEPSA